MGEDHPPPRRFQCAGRGRKIRAVAIVAALHHKGGFFQQALPFPPLGEGGEHIAAHAEKNLSPGVALLQHPHRVDGVVSAAAADLPVRDGEVRVQRHKALAHGQPQTGRGGAGRLVRWDACGHDHHLIRMHRVDGTLQQAYMALVGRIKGPPKQKQFHRATPPVRPAV